MRCPHATRAPRAPERGAAARAIAGVIADDELHAEYIIPSVFNRRVVEAIAEAVADAAVASGVARRTRETAESEALPG